MTQQPSDRNQSNSNAKTGEKEANSTVTADQGEITSANGDSPQRSNRTLIGILLVSALAFFLYLMANAKPQPGPADKPLPAMVSYHSPGDHARAEIAGLLARNKNDIDQDALYKKAEQFRADGAMADAYILYFFAARHGHGLSALRLGMMSDPAYNDSYKDILTTPDLYQSLKWYRQARAAGVKEVDEPLNTLDGLIRKRAEEGDPQAKRLLLEVE